MIKKSLKSKLNKEVYYMSLSEIFNKFVPLVIPAYQRGYAWEDKHIKDLIQDIEDIMEFSKKEHFTGTIVLSENKNKYLIVDGQQRLTSLFILLKSIYNTTHDQNLFENYIIQKINNDSQSRLSTQNDTNNFFEEFIVDDNINIDIEIYSHKRIKAAKVQFDEWINSKQLQEINDILDTVTNRLRFIVYKPNNYLNAPAMFEIINNRGKNLSEIEKIKNYFVYIATSLGENHSLHKKIAESWEGMLKNLNKADIHTIDEENSFLRACFITFFSSSKLKYQNIYKTLKEEIFPIKAFSQKNTDISDKLIKFLRFIQGAAKYYSCIVSPSNCNPIINQLSNTINLQIKYLACQKNISSITPLFLAIMSRDDLIEKDQEELLKYLEILNFRMYVLPRVLTRSDNGQSELYNIANQFYEKSLSVEDLKNKLETISLAWVPITKFVEAMSLSDDDAYDFASWSGLKYFLAKYEEYLEDNINRTFDIASIEKTRKDCKSGDYLSVEHIWARKNRLQYAAEDYIAKRRLGNLVLLELTPNISAGNEDIEKKLNENNDIESRISIIDRTNLLQGKELKKFFETVSQRLKKLQRKGKWYYCSQGKYLDDEREKKLIKFAINTWHFPNENTKKAEKLLDDKFNN